jgi:hypothetical protein
MFPGFRTSQYEIMVPELIGPHMPISDIAGVIGRLCESVPESLMFGTESNLVNDHTGTGLIFSGHQRCAVRRTHRGGSNGLMQVASLRRERVDVRRPCALIAGLAAGGKAQLVGKNTRGLAASPHDSQRFPPTMEVRRRRRERSETHGGSSSATSFCIGV